MNWLDCVIGFISARTTPTLGATGGDWALAALTASSAARATPGKIRFDPQCLCSVAELSGGADWAKAALPF